MREENPHAPFTVGPDEKTTHQALHHPYPNDFAYSLGRKAFNEGDPDVGYDVNEEFQKEFLRGWDDAYFYNLRRQRNIESNIRRKKSRSTP
jgi:hypothetical protein